MISHLLAEKIPNHIYLGSFTGFMSYFCTRRELLPVAIHAATQRSCKLLQGARYRNYLKYIRFKTNLDNKFSSNMTLRNLLKDRAWGRNEGNIINIFSVERYVIN